MRNDFSLLRIYICGLVVVLLQLFLAPIISINAVVPNFILAYAIVVMVVRPDKMALGFAFIMGLLFDLICNGPVGSMAFVMIIVCFIICKILTRLENPNFVLMLIVIALSVLFIEFFYGVFQVSLTVNAGFIDLLAYRVLPCSLYDMILAFLMFPIMIRLISPLTYTSVPNQNSVNNSR